MKHRNLLTLLFGSLLGCAACQSSDSTIRTVNATEFGQLIKDSKPVQLVDVRTPEEFQAGHIPGAILIDVKSADFNRLAEEKLKKDLPVAVYCRSGMRSLKAANQLKEKGFKPIYNLKGGFMEWQDNRFATE